MQHEQTIEFGQQALMTTLTLVGPILIGLRCRWCSAAVYRVGGQAEFEGRSIDSAERRNRKRR